MRLIITTLLCLALAGCGTGRLLSYGGQLSDASVRLGPAQFSVYVHPSDDTLLIQRAISQTSSTDGAALIGIVAEQFLEPVGCTHGPAASIAAGSWEVPFDCPDSIDLRSLVADQRQNLRAGASIQPPR